MPERFKKGGNVSRLIEGSSEDKKALFEQATKEGAWLAASVKTNQLFPELIENVTEAITAYKAAMETGKTLLNANKAFLLASINPLFLVLDQMISKIQNSIDDLMGSGIYTLFVDGQNPKLSYYDVKSRTPNIRLKKTKTAGIFVNPFTNKIEFTAYPIVDIDQMKAAEGNQPHKAGVPHAKSWEMYENNFQNYVIWNGKVFYNKKIPGVEGSGQGKPVLDKSGGEFLDINLEDYLWKLGGQMQICKPSKMVEIMNASFDDKGDVGRPIISEDGTAGALIILLGTTDPAKIVEKLAKLYNYFADIRPLKDAFDIAVELTNDLDALREEKIIVTNLCAPNPGNTDPPIEDWPIKPGKKSSIKADRDMFKIGTNSDNNEKFRRRGFNIDPNKEDKVFFKNLRTREVMQILETGEARKFEAATSGGTAETSNAEWYDHITPGVSATAAEASIDLFTQGATDRYEQEIDVLHETLFPSTRAGDILVEVELDDRFGVIDDEGEETKPDPGGGDAFKVMNTFVLKNGTKIFGEDDQKENIMKNILARRRWKNSAGQAGKQQMLYEYYNGKIDQGKYDQELTYDKPITADESIKLKELFAQGALEAYDAVTECMQRIENLHYKVDTLKARTSSAKAYQADTAKQEKLAAKKAAENRIGEIKGRIEASNDQIRLKETEISEWESEKRKQLKTLSTEEAALVESADEQIDAQENVNDTETKLAKLEKELSDYETSAQKKLWNDKYTQEYLSLSGQGKSEADAISGAKAHADAESTPANTKYYLQTTDINYNAIQKKRNETRTELAKTKRILDDAQFENATAKRIYEDSYGTLDIDGIDDSINQGKESLSLYEKSKHTLQTKLSEKEAEIIQIDTDLSILELEIASTRSNFEDQISALNREIENEKTLLANLREERDEKSAFAADSSNYDMFGTLPTVARGKVKPNDNADTSSMGEPEYVELSGGPDSAGEALWKEFLTDLVNDDPDNQDVDALSLDVDELGDLTDEESEWAVHMILKGSGLNADDINIEILRYFESILDGYMWLPHWRNQGTKKLPAPRVCSVKAVNKNTLKKEDLPESVYPDFWSKNVEDMIPGLRPILELLIEFLEGLKAIGSGIIKKIEDLVEFIEEKLIPKLEKILKMMEEFLALIKIGIMDAGIYFLWIPPALGGTAMIRKKLVNAKNPPPENLDFTYGMMLLLAGADARGLAKVMEASGLV